MSTGLERIGDRDVTTWRGPGSPAAPLLTRWFEPMPIRADAGPTGVQAGPPGPVTAASAEHKERGIAFRSLTEQMDTTAPQGEFLFHVFGVLAQFERSLTQERVRAGLVGAADAPPLSMPRSLQPFSDAAWWPVVGVRSAQCAAATGGMLNALFREPRIGALVVLVIETRGTPV